MASIAEILGGDSTAYKLLAQKLLGSIRVCMPGVIESFDELNQTATVKPTINDNIVQDGKQEWVPLPVLPDVPVSFPRGGDWMLTLPVKTGDACILHFADSCIDSFIQSGTDSTQAEVRHHDLSDAMAVVGISTWNAAVGDYAPDKLELRHKDKPIKVTLYDEDVVIEYKDAKITLSDEGLHCSYKGKKIEIADDKLELLFQGSNIKMGSSRITLRSGVVDVNGTLF